MFFFTFYSRFCFAFFENFKCVWNTQKFLFALYGFRSQCNPTPQIKHNQPIILINHTHTHLVSDLTTAKLSTTRRVYWSSPRICLLANRAKWTSAHIRDNKIYVYTHTHRETRQATPQTKLLTYKINEWGDDVRGCERDKQSGDERPRSWSDSFRCVVILV